MDPWCVLSQNHRGADATRSPTQFPPFQCGAAVGDRCVTSAMRQANLDRLRADRLDLLVIGGGITGAGILLDGTLRGLKVGLVDKGDFASGTSSASSKLIHGGLRYLEHGELGLVREALRERHTLLRIAPHLVRPLKILLPHYTASNRPRWMLKVGLALYDWLAGPERIGCHRWLDVAEVQAIAPGLRTQDLSGGFEFFDAQMDDSRLCLEVVLTALHGNACAANYVEVVELHRDRHGQVHGCEAIDRLSGESLGIQARRIVNATGPWLDEISRIDDTMSPPRLAPTKGAHIILPGIGLNAGLLVTHPEDGRVMFIIPWMGRTLVGTTDSFFNDRPDKVAADACDIAYLLAAVDYYFCRTFSSSAVVATLVGLRPLLRRRTKNPSSMSREFTIFRARSGLWSIAGGKYTTYRSMAERLVDRIVHDLGAPCIPCKTRDHRLVGTPSEDWSTFRDREAARLAQRQGIDRQSASHLLNRYGKRVFLLEDVTASDRAHWNPVMDGEPDLEAELAFQSIHEMAVSPSDHLLRRTRLGLFHPELLTGLFKWPKAAGFSKLSS